MIFKAPTPAKPAQTRHDHLHQAQGGTTGYLPELRLDTSYYKIMKNKFVNPSSSHCFSKVEKLVESLNEPTSTSVFELLETLANINTLLKQRLH
jgi:hypothetical protein